MTNYRVAGSKRIHCACGKAGLSVLEETENGAKSLGNVATPAGAHTLAVDPEMHAVWIAYAKEDEADVVRPSVRRQGSRFRLRPAKAGLWPDPACQPESRTCRLLTTL